MSYGFGAASVASPIFETDVVAMPDAIGGSVGAHLSTGDSAFGLSARCRASLTFGSNELGGECSGSLRYTLDVFRYVPWFGVGMGVELRRPSLVPRAEIGLLYMMGFDDALTVRISMPLNSLRFRGSPRPVLGLGWSHRF